MIRLAVNVIKGEWFMGVWGCEQVYAIPKLHDMCHKDGGRVPKNRVGCFGCRRLFVSLHHADSEIRIGIVIYGKTMLYTFWMPGIG